MDTFVFVVFLATHVLHLADVIAFCCLVCVADVIHQVGIVTCCLVSGRCYNHQADIIACTFYFWQMLPSFVVADVIAIVCNYSNF